ncbi:jerky protein homolog-like [Ochlerotatus camptorhynchus]|uniref:jerky protein homolog-like n=1 Tax=Ochlerotatus camptorhynchus TaxID=644619 RepID=UPI0031DB6F96
MDQHVIQLVKARYKKIMTNEILGRGDDFHDNVKRINIKDAMFWIAQAWEAVPESAIQKSWKILYTETPGDDEDDLPLSVLQERLRNIMNNINQLETIDEENAEFEILKDDEIVEKILNPSVDDFFYTTNQDHEDSQHLSTSVDPEDENVNVSDEAALNGADVLLRYAEEQVHKVVLNAAKPIISEYQHGFIPHRSTTTNLLCYTNVLFREIERRNQVDSIYIDFSKAFDTVPHAYATEKLKHMGFPDWVADWIRSYLTG